ncbi:MAG: hypothetical protein EXS05_07535 [Planctomycetaceae bacterium]|nr:hypothetical protein [Planctomycetaceae bacterium]
MARARRRLFARRRILSWLTVACALLAAIGGPSRASAKVTDREIQAAVDRAVVYLRQNLRTPEGGHLSLTVLALLKAGVPADSPDLQPVIATIAARFDANGRFIPGGHHNYDAGVTLMALANADRQKYKRQIEAIAKFLIEWQGPDGDWDYPMRTTGDTSISQYAILGLWEAARSGVSVPRSVWSKAAGWHVTRQQIDGGFTYHPVLNQAGSPSSHTMTVAGTSSLLVARLHLYGDLAAEPDSDETPAAGRKKSGKKFGVLTPGVPDADENQTEKPVEKADGGPIVRLVAIEKAVKGGRKWLDDRFAVAPATSWQLYYLYGVERLAALAGLQKIDGHDWYDEGADYLLKKQTNAGNWDDQCGAPAATSLGVMFLVKATAKALNRPRRDDPRFGGGLLVGGRGLPENLQEVQLDKGTVKVRKLKGPVDELLAELENVQSQKVESAQSTLVELVATDNPEALVGQKERLLKLVNDKRVDVRRTAYWALGRTNDLRVVPVLIEGLLDPELSCMVESRNALRYVSKRINAFDLPDEPTEAQRREAVAYWKKWYQSIRPYDERDDLAEIVKP